MADLIYRAEAIEKAKHDYDFFKGSSNLLDEDRIALVKECGWSCNGEYLDRERDCPVCPAAEWCDSYQNFLQ